MTSTRVALPFTFDTTILPPRHRNRDHVTILDLATVEIPHVDPADAPVVVRERLPPGWDPSISGLEFRHDGRTFLRPVAIGGRHFSERLGAERFATEMQENLRRPPAHYPTVVKSRDTGALLHHGKLLTGPQPDLREDPEVRAWETEAFVRRASDAFRSVDGVVHVRCPEPVVECRIGSDGPYANRLVTVRETDPHTAEVIFHLPLHPGRLTAAGVDLDHLSRVEILDDARIPEDPRPYLAEFASACIDAALDGKAPPTVTSDEVAWWLSVLRILEATGVDGSKPDPDVLMDEMGRLGRLTELAGIRNDLLDRLLKVGSIHSSYVAGTRFDPTSDDMLSLAGATLR